MKKFTFLKEMFFFCILFLAMISPSHSQVTVPVATGSETGSYYRFISQASLVCQDDVKIANRKSAGSTENLDLMEANEVSLGISQLDILDLYKRTRDMSTVKLVVPLFPEQVHFVARADLTKMEGQKSMFGIGIPGTGNKVQLQTAADLAGKRVGAAGGSLKTAQLISILGGFPMDIRDTGSPDEALKQVLAGTLDAAILVGAQPLGTLVNLKADILKVRLLPVPEALAAKLSSVYGKAQPLTYRAMGAGGDSVPTVQVMSALVTQNYPKSSMGDAVYAFQQCLLREASTQATVPGNHPAWRNLRVSSGINWDVWQYQAAKPVAPAKK